MRDNRWYHWPARAVLIGALLLVGSLVFADLTITAGNVVPATGYTYVDGTAGETITAGQTLYLKTSDSRYWKADADASAATAVLAGIALNGASAGQPLRVQTAGEINPGATVTVGEMYVLSDTAGGIQLHSELDTGDKVCLVGVATTSSNIQLSIRNTGATKP